MIRPLSLFMMILLAAGMEARSQCEDCLIEEADSGDYCYRNGLFVDYCASFIDQADQFWIKLGSKSKQLPYTDTAGVEYFLALAADKKLKLKSEDILFRRFVMKRTSAAKM